MHFAVAGLKKSFIIQGVRHIGARCLEVPSCLLVLPEQL